MWVHAGTLNHWETRKIKYRESLSKTLKKVRTAWLKMLKSYKQLLFLYKHHCLKLVFDRWASWSLMAMVRFRKKIRNAQWICTLLMKLFQAIKLLENQISFMKLKNFELQMLFWEKCTRKENPWKKIRGLKMLASLHLFY